MAIALVQSPVRWRLLLLSLGLLVVVGATAYGQIELNRWNRPFYDALSHRELGGFLHQLAVFGLIAGTLLALNVAQQWLTQMLTLKLRAGLVHDLVQHWLLGRRAFRLAHADAMGVNPDQRMHEDARHLTELSATLGIGLLQASMLLGAFVAVLWKLSSDFTFRLGSHRWAIPGYMVWAALVYAGSASLLSYWVGRGLIKRNAERYASEAVLRFSLVRVNEHIDAVALAGGEADEERRIERDLDKVLAAMRRLVTGLTNLTWVTAGYGWFTLVAPIIAAAPLYFFGSLSFGGLMMAAGAFNQVQSSLRWFVDNFSTIADWRATLLRVAVFRMAVARTDTLHSVEQQITFAEGEPGTLLLEDLQIASPSGCTRLEETHAQIRTGERLLIAGKPGTGRTLLFRTLAGLWPWGSGRIVRPRGEEMLYLPRQAYLPPGTLRAALAYPRGTEHYESESFKHALVSCELGELVQELDASGRWDDRLGENQRLQLQVARAVLHAAPWVIIDDWFDSVSEIQREQLIAILLAELPHSAIIHIGAFGQHPQFPRVLHLLSDPQGRRLQRSLAAAA
jgi:putative ATP-binding cassette transporter